MAKLDKIFDELVSSLKHQTALRAVPPRQAFLKGTRNHNGSKQNVSNANQEELKKNGQLFQATIHSDPNDLQPKNINTSLCALVKFIF